MNNAAGGRILPSIGGMWKAWLMVLLLAGRAVADPVAVPVTTPAAPIAPSSCKSYRAYLEPMLLYHADFTNDFANRVVVRAASGLRYRDCDGTRFQYQLEVGLSVASAAYAGNGLGGVELDLGWNLGRFVVGPHVAIESAFGSESMTQWTFGARARGLDAVIFELDLIRGSSAGQALPVGVLAGFGFTGKAGVIASGVLVGATLTLFAIFVAAGGFGH